MSGSRTVSLRSLAALMLAFALVAGACSDDDSASGEPLDLDGWLDRGTTTSAPDDTTSTTTADDGAVSSIDWDTSSRLHTATIEVPLDHEDPDGETIELALARRPASNADQRIGAILVNPGGPGASGLDLAGLFSFLFSADLRDRFDIVTWDPRGVGESTRVSCGDGELMDRYVGIDPVPATPEDEAEIESVLDEFVAACEEDSGWLLPHLNTEASARDMDLIRAGLGDDQISYVGFSYGTLLGATYAELHPDRVRAFVLDGAYSRSLGMAELSEGQALGFERSLETFFEWCRNESCAFDDGTDLGESFDTLMETIRSKPLPADDGDGRVLTVGLAWTGVLAAMYTPELWSQIAGALADARDEGDGSGLMALADFYNERSPGAEFSAQHYAFVAYNCMDSPPTTDSEEQAAIDRVLQAAPRVGPVFVSAPSPCDQWPVDPVGSDEPFSVPDAPPILVIATTGDPATPYDWGVQLAEELETAELLTVEGDTHTAYAGGNSCVDDIVESYLIDAEIPDVELSC